MKLQFNHFRPIIFGVLAVLIWAAIPAFVKVGSTVETLPFLLVLRFLIASLFFLPSIPSVREKCRTISAKSWLALTVILGANFYFQGLAMIELPVSWYLVIFCLNPILALLLLKIRLNWKVFLGLAGCVAGTLLFINPEEISTQYSIYAFICLFIGMLTWVIYTLMSKRFQQVLTSVEMTAVTQWLSLMAAAVIWIGLGSQMFKIDAAQMGAVVALGVFTPLAYYFFNACLRTHPKFSIVSQYLEPVFGIVIGFAFFGEQLGMIQLIGTALIVAGSTVIES
jgi:drug/metabolite transporter (DMT)-like permease